MDKGRVKRRNGLDGTTVLNHNTIGTEQRGITGGGALMCVERGITGCGVLTWIQRVGYLNGRQGITVWIRSEQ